MDWLKKLTGNKETEPTPESEPVRSQPESPPESRQYAPDEVNQYGDYIKIGGSPVPGLTLRHVWRGHTHSIHRIAWSPSGNLLASPSRDNTVRIWDWPSGVSKRILSTESWLNAAVWSPDENFFAAGDEWGIVSIWRISDWKKSYSLNGHHGRIESLAWHKNGHLLASASGDGTVIIWSLESGKKIYQITEHRKWVNAVVWSPDGTLLATGAEDNRVRIWNHGTWDSVATSDRFPDWVTDIVWHPNGKSLVFTNGNSLMILDPFTGEVTQKLEGHTGRVKCGSFSSDGRLLTSKSEDGTVRIWRTDKWKEIVKIYESTVIEVNPENSIAFHPKKQILATIGENDLGIRIWQIDTDRLLGSAINKEAVMYVSAKLVLVGDTGVGKTGLGWRLAHGEFKEQTSTHGQQFWSIPQLGLQRKDGAECEAVLWDLAGQHVYRQVHSIFLENVAAALVLFDPTNRQEPLKGAQFWLEHLKGKGKLPPTVLVGARVDRGAPALSQAELEQFCQRYGVSGGYLSTSAMTGAGLAQLLEILKAQIPWDEMTATVTTGTFKRIKDHVLSLKETPDRKGVLVSPKELRALLEETSEVSETSEVWTFTDAEMMSAVGHLETNGIVAILKSASGESNILLAPELLVNIAASIMLLADKNARELGAVSETDLLGGRVAFEELKGLEKTEQQILTDAAILRFLEHNICVRETLNTDTLLIFPSLIKQKRPLQDDLPATDDVSYMVRGRVENLYASLVVLLGYTPTFSRINQWQNQAQYEMEPSQVCGFRSIEEREGEIELILYYADAMPQAGRDKFQELFEQFLYQRDVDVTSFPPVVCKNQHRIERATVVKRVREGKDFVFCDECGEKTFLPDFDKRQTIGIGASPWLQREEAIARLRSSYEKHLTNIKSYRRGWATPRAYLSHLPEQKGWAKKLIHDLQDAGVYVVENPADLQDDDFAIILDTTAYQKAFLALAPVLGKDSALLRARLGKKNMLSLACDGSRGEHDIRQCTPGDFCDETHYAVSLFNLVLNLYAIPLTHKGFEPLRQALHAQWERTLAKYAGAHCAEIHEAGKETQGMDYQDFQVLVTAEHKIRASSEQGEEWGELRLDMNRINLTISLVEQRQTNTNLLKNLGGELYQALFPNVINAQWHATRATAEAAGCGVRLRLICEPPELAALPWEFLYDERTNTFLANDVQTALSRYLDVPQSKRPLGRSSRPLKILLVISSPTDLLPLDVTGEEAFIREALEKHTQAGLVELDVVREATIRNITQQLRLKPYNVFHFIGHGDFQNDAGVMALVEPDGKKRLLDEEAFANLFLGNRSIGLAILNSCRGAQASSYQAVTGVAPRLVQRGLPAVVAMQYAILDTTAKLFANEFYRTLALGWPVDAAIQSTRNCISIEVGADKPDFATPVLYMRTKDGVIMRGL